MHRDCPRFRIASAAKYDKIETEMQDTKNSPDIQTDHQEAAQSQSTRPVNPGAPRIPKLLVTVLIAINVVIYMMWNYGEAFGVSPGFMIDNFLVSYDGLVQGRLWTLLTSAFSHNMFLHIILNMFVLNSFGPIVDYTLGPKRFLGFYIGAGMLGSLSHALVSKFIMGEGDIPALGASGAISGIILLFSLLYPRQKILMFAFIPVPAILGALLFVGLDIWGLVAQAEGGGLPIGHGAHLGGSLAGLIYYFILRAEFRNRFHD